jgi:hypothetical protein
MPRLFYRARPLSGAGGSPAAFRVSPQFDGVAARLRAQLACSRGFFRVAPRSRPGRARFPRLQWRALRKEPPGNLVTTFTSSK